MGSVSSAKRQTSSFFDTFGNSFIKSRNSKGTGINPYGKPQVTLGSSEFIS